MKTHAEKVSSTHANVTFNGWDYTVTAKGDVLFWSLDGWVSMNENNKGYNQIRQAGINILEH